MHQEIDIHPLLLYQINEKHIDFIDHILTSPMVTPLLTLAKNSGLGYFNHLLQALLHIYVVACLIGFIVEVKDIEGQA